MTSSEGLDRSWACTQSACATPISRNSAWSSRLWVSASRSAEAGLGLVQGLLDLESLDLNVELSHQELHLEGVVVRLVRDELCSIRGRHRWLEVRKDLPLLYAVTDARELPGLWRQQPTRQRHTHDRLGVVRRLDLPGDLKPLGQRAPFHMLHEQADLPLLL